MRENAFQSNLKKELLERFPGCIVLKNDANLIQGFPDITVLYKDKWAVLECKASANATKQPNQEYYVKKLGDMSYAAFIYPENREEVLNEIQRSFES